ncbi:MAG: hypothetical protein NTV89_10835, partial [Proteobacteria bacterium]|nr:hypothetical protein [Pseudomonadota bacterium]
MSNEYDKKITIKEGDRLDAADQSAMKKVKREATAGLKQVQPRQSGKRGTGSAWVLLLCMGLGFVLYGNSLRNEFVFDDLPLIV